MKNNATNSPVLTLVYGAAIAAIYVVLTMVFLPISFGPIQFRISELLCVLPYFTPAAIPGLFIGCLLANFLGGAAALDVIFGSIATLIGAVGSYLLRKNRYLVSVPNPEAAAHADAQAAVQATQVEVNATHERAGAEEENGAENKTEN